MPDVRTIKMPLASYFLQQILFFLEIHAVTGKNPENKMPDENERRLLNKLLCEHGVEFMEIGIAETDKEIFECYEVLSQLRPQLEKEYFVGLIRDLMLTQGYKLVYLKESDIKSVMGIRIGLWLHTGKYLEIEDLVTSSKDRSNGYGEQLLKWAKEYAKRNNCNQVRLVSGVSREQAHKFYQKNGMSFEAKYFSINI